MKKLFVYTAFAATFLLNSCIDSNVVAPVNTSFPLGQINYNDSLLFNLAGLGDIIKPNEESVLAITSSEKVEIITPDMLNTLFEFKHQDLKFAQSTGINPPEDAPLDTLFELEEPIIFDVVIEGFEEHERLDEIAFDTCYISVNVANAPDGSTLSEMRWEILELDTIKREVNQTYDIGYRSIAGKRTSLKPTNKDSKPHLTIRITGKIPLMLTIEGNVVIDCKKYNEMWGFVGRKVIEVAPTTFDFSAQLQEVAKNVEEAYFANPYFAFEFSNWFGIPILVKITEIKIDDIPLRLSADIEKTQFLIPDAYYPNSPEKAYFVFDNSSTINNDLSNRININTSKITLTAVAVANPTIAEDGIDGGVDTNVIMNEVYYRPQQTLNMNHFDATYNAELPLIGYIKNLNFEQIYNDVSFEFEDAEWQKLTLAFTGENTILLDFDIDLYTYDENDEKIKLTEIPLRIPAAISETEKYVIDNNNMPFIALDKEQIALINNSKKLILNYVGSTKNIASKEIVRLVSPASIKLNLIIDVKLQP